MVNVKSFLASRVGVVTIQAASAFVVTFLAQLVADNFFDVSHITNMSTVEKAAVAGLGAALAVIRSVVAALISDGQVVTLSNAVRYRRAKSAAKHRSGL